ncbi:hypothetical protein E8E13_010733 [Curvularia kusanoi]|uniref:Uncharacterized protein n=1 Tax=Curvularia kusanoi TaxID=90978 RepID=A0A9P4WEE9_CURKU|nr:hypothetical protein E8E13_010733 [Curvularia kusanoi]
MSLGKRKRIDDDDDEEIMNSGFKRRKILKTYPWLFNSTETYLVNLFCVKHIHAPPKPPSFNLFRLPYEIRDKIFRHAYGNQTVHVDITNRRRFGQVINPRLTYTIGWGSFHPNRKIPLQLPPLVSKSYVPCATAPQWKDFWRYIRLFRQFKLSPRHTEFKVDVYTEQKDSQVWKKNPLKPGDASYEDMMELQRVLTDGLLDHSPRRLSRRLADKRRTGFQVNSMGG